MPMADDTVQPGTSDPDQPLETAMEAGGVVPVDPPADPSVEPQEPQVTASEPPAPTAESVSEEPAVAVTLEIPPREPAATPSPESILPPATGSDEEGGEWELLLSKLRGWLASGQLQQLWGQTRTPLTAVAALVAALLVLRIYSSLVGAIDSLPLVPGLLELIGLIWLVRFGVPKLLRRSERQQLLSGLQKRRQDFLG